MIDREDRGDVTILRLAHGKANALDTALCEALRAALDEADRDDRRALVLTASGKIFSAGVDLKQVAAGGTDYLASFLPALSGAFRRLFAFPRPVIVALNGHAIAGGAVLACACDHRLMAAGGGRTGVPELVVGVPFPPMGLEIMRAAVPAHQLNRILLFGETYTAQEAASLGLVDEVVEPDALLQQALARAQTLASLEPGAFALTKRQLRAPALERVDAAGEVEKRVMSEWCSDAGQAAINAYVAKTFGK